MALHTVLRQEPVAFFLGVAQVPLDQRRRDVRELVRDLDERRRVALFFLRHIRAHEDQERERIHQRWREHAWRADLHGVERIQGRQEKRVHVLVLFPHHVHSRREQEHEKVRRLP